MLSVHKSNTYSKCATAVYDVLKKRRGNNEKHILIVPSRFTMEMERGILDYLGILGSYDIEVVSFERLAAKLLKGEKEKYLSPEGAVMLLRKVINEKNEELAPYISAHSLSEDGFASEIFAVISSIRNSSIGVDDMLRISESLPIKKRKTLNVIRIIYSAYMEALTDKFSDATTRLELLAKRIPDVYEMANCNIYITDFDSFTSKQYQVIKALVSTCLNVDVGVVTMVGSGNARIFPTRMFETLKLIAEATGVGFRSYNVPDDLKGDAVKNTLWKNLFSYVKHEGGTVREKANDLKIEATEATDTEEEISLVAEKICRLIRGDGGYRYKDIAVVTSNAEAYSSVIARVFKRYGIPFFLDDRKLLITEPLIKFILAVIEVQTSVFSQKSVISLLNNYFFDIELEKKEVFEDYVQKFSIKNNRFLKSFTLGEDIEREIAEEVREKLINCVFAMKNAKMSINEHIYNLKKLLAGSRADELQQRLYDTQKDTFLLYAARSAQVPEKLSGLIDSMQELLGEEETTLSDFAAVFKEGAGYNKIAMIPQFLDSVFVGEITENRYSNVKALFIVGATEGEVPKEASDTGLLRQSDADLWAKQELFISPTAREQARSVRFNLLQLLLKPERLFVSYPKGHNGTECNPSLLFSELKNLFGITPIKEKPEGVYSVSNAEKLLAEKIRSFKDNTITSSDMKKYDNLLESIPEEGKHRLLSYSEEIRHANVSEAYPLFFGRGFSCFSQLETYFSCPYKHFVCYGLRAKEKEKGEITALDYGNFIHAVLESFLKNKAYETLADSEIERLVDEVTENEKFVYFAEKDEIAMWAIKKDAFSYCVRIREMLSYSLYKPKEEEKSFGFNGTDAIKLTDKVSLSGKIDRIDEYNESSVIIDYKTGEVDATLGSIYYGIKIQLIIYSYALTNVMGKKAKVVGSFYLHLSNKYSDKQKALTYEGLLVDENDRVLNLDRREERRGNRVVVPSLGIYLSGKDSEAKYRNDGKVKLLDKADFERILKHTFLQAQNAVDEITEGFIEPSPLGSENEQRGYCDYCSMLHICGNYEKKRRILGQISLSSFLKGETPTIIEDEDGNDDE